jgi:5-methylcytosine-specific restriction endonuclease McrA
MIAWDIVNGVGSISFGLTLFVLGVEMRDFAKTFYNSTAWKKCRLTYIASVHGLCELCGSAGKIVHHKIYLSPKNIDDPNITLSHSNLQLLCHYCHNDEHLYSPSVKKGLKFDEEGNLKPKFNNP